ncbi:MAG: methionyl-tRNA formyltransferase, partial [Parvibaculum sedimenti]
IWRARVSEGSGKPGEVLSLRPLVVAAGEGAVEVVHFGFEGEDEAGASEAMLATLKVGDRLGESA